MSRSQRSALNYVSGIGLTVVSMVTGLIATPLLLRWLGTERLGAFRAASDWLGYLGLLELGLGAALMPLLVRAIGEHDENRVAGVMRAGFDAFIKISLWMLAVGILLALRIDTLVPVSAGNHRDLQVGLCIGLLGLIFVPLSPFRALAEASQRGYFVNIAFAGQGLLITGTTLVLAHAGFGIRGQFMAVIAGGIFFQAALWVDARRRRAVPLRGAPSVGLVRESEKALWSLNRPTLLLLACGRIALLTDNIVIAFFLSPALVVPFLLTQRLTQVAQSQLQSIGGATWAALSELHVTGKAETFNRRLVELTRLISVLGLSATIPIVCYNRHFISLWVGSAQYGGPLLTALAGLNAVLQGIFSLWTWVFSGTGKVPSITRLHLVAVAVNLPVSILATEWLGLPGPVLGTTVAFLTVFIWWEPQLLKKEFGTSPGDLLGAIARPSLVAAPFAGILWIVAQGQPTLGWTGLGLQMASGGAALLILMWRLALGPDERRSWLESARFAVQRRMPIAPKK